MHSVKLLTYLLNSVIMVQMQHPMGMTQRLLVYTIL